jgi:signal transduction histidine kinase
MPARLLLSDRQLDQQLQLLELALQRLSHDVANDLAAVMGWLELAQVSADSKSQAAQLAQIYASTESIVARMRSRRAGLRPPREQNRSRVSVRDLVATAIERTQPLLDAPRAIQTARHIEDYQVDVDPDHASLGLLQLLLNALEASPNSPEVSVHAGQFIEISVRDNGIGAPGDVLARCGEPFFSQFAAGGHPHWGLGLASAYRCAAFYGGGLMVASDGPQRGFEATLLLPKAS